MMSRVRWSVLTGVIGIFLMAARGAHAQQTATISGKVTTDAGQPLGGAIVALVQLGIGVATDPEGIYSITVPADRVRGQPLTVSVRSIGYAPGTHQLTLTPGGHSVSFTLKYDPLELDEVVVTGVADATSSRKLAFTVGALTETQIQQAPAVDPLRALAGKVAGVQVAQSSGMPGSAPTLRLRSATTLTPGASQAPLLIVDGVITYGTLADINSQDIERVEVIKGAAASSLYGSNAAAGVVQVFTRRGRHVPEGVTRMTMRHEYGQSGLERRLPINQSHYCDVTTLASSGTCVVEADRIADNAYPASRPFRDQQDAILGNGEFFTNYLSVMGRQGNTNYMASFENQKNAGILDIPGVNDYGVGRQTARLNVDQRISDRLELSFGGFYSSSKNREVDQGPGSPFFSVLFMPPDVDLFAPNDNGQPFKVDAGASGAIVSTDANPLYNAYTEEDRKTRSRFQGTARARWRPVDWIVVEGDYAYDRQSEEERDYLAKGTLSASGTPGTGSLFIDNDYRRSYNATLSTTVSRRFGDLASTTKFAGIFERDYTSSTDVTGQQFSSAAVPSLDNTPDVLASIGSQITETRTNNFYVSQDLDFRDRYILGGLVRRDGSSRFGRDARWATYYRLSGAWRVTEDITIPHVDELRLRASHGTAGLRPPFAAQYEVFSASGGLIQPDVLGNTFLKPARSAETEVGFNAELLGRFSLEYNYSRKTTRDQLILVNLSAVAGFTEQWQNVGELFGITHEASLGAVIVNKPGLVWQANLTFDRSRAWITDFPLSDETRGGGTQSSTAFLIREGIVYGTMWGNRFVRNIDDLYHDPAKAALSGVGQTWSPDSVVVNEEGYVVRRNQWRTVGERPIKYTDANGNQYVQIGDANPDFNVGISNTLTFGNFSLYGLLNWVQGGDVYNQPRQWLSRAEFRAAEIDQAGKPVAERKPVDYYATFNDANNFNDFYVEDGTYVRLRELSLTWNVPEGALSRLGFSRWARSMRLGFLARNLFTITNYTGLDPEAANFLETDGDPTTFRFDAFAYPNFRTFSGFIEIGF